MEEMAIAVLRGDYVAARALCDIIVENGEMSKTVVRMKKLNAAGKIRILLFPERDAHMDEVVLDVLDNELQEWIKGERTIGILFGVKRVEFYEVKNGTPGKT